MSWSITVYVAALLAVAVRLYFWAVTGYVYDDAYITLTYAANWAAGHGPVPFPGVHVMGFSNPLALMVMAVGEATFIGGMNLILAVSALAGGVTVLLAWDVARRMGSPPRGAAIWCAMLAVYPAMVRNGKPGGCPGGGYAGRPVVGVAAAQPVAHGDRDGPAGPEPP